MDSVDVQEFERRDDVWQRAVEVTGQPRVEVVGAGLEYDGSERRRQFASSLEDKAEQKTIDARILADGENVKHPREGVRTKPGRAARPRKKANGGAQQRTRGGSSR